MNIDFWPKNPKANFQNAKMNLTSAHITSYQLPVTNHQYENKAKTNPIKPNFLQNVGWGLLFAEDSAKAD